jgi:hypothetical protein
MQGRLTARREAWRRELCGAQILHAQMRLVIGTLDMALSRGNAKWLPSLADHRALTTAWREHWEGLDLGPDLVHWKVLQEAVDGVSPIETSGFSGGYYPELRRVLIQRRERLIDATEILQVIIDRPRLFRDLELKWLAAQREKKWISRYDLRDHDRGGPPSSSGPGATLGLRPCPPTDSSLKFLA